MASSGSIARSDIVRMVKPGLVVEMREESGYVQCNIWQYLVEKSVDSWFWIIQ